ncbi:hypothetical protein Lfu02_29180 [Longispora fulva]|uniref:DUF3995 domain-containing protein n=1 Tax=Longispora fulva TaxID=619741 RepID=A0A8J7GEC1_9ACTN|nr:DUF3995 domain-containing protein [Longispora fulva]MBG6139053.1 hypothetical protein [Longispora fulva]GIG58546.1 hypothetical protein Lfu02_29180 [Longispora fulva]
MRIAAGVAAVTLALISALHVIWIFSPWPLATRADFARLVVGVPEDRTPSGALTGLVAGLIAVAGYVVAARAGLVPEIGPRWVYAAGAFTVAAVLGLRGVGGLVGAGVRGSSMPEFNALDLRIYSPLCAVLAGLSLWVALSPGD